MKKTLIFSTIAAMFASLFGCSGNKAVVDESMTKVVHPEWSRNAVIYEVNWRQSTENGTLAEYTEQLPRLKELGVDILWFMPIHPISEVNRKGELGSYYAVRDYKDVNPELGTLEEFKTFVKKAHEMGMKVILDWVPNHSGCDNAWLTEHPDWYVYDENGNFVSPYDWTDTYKFDYSNLEMRKGMIDALSFWLRDVDVDGFRCDVAGEVPTDFWNEARPQLNAVKSDIFMLAEASVPELEKEAFDMAYNWPMKDLFNQIAATAGFNTCPENHTYPTKYAVDIDTLLAEQAAAYPKDSYMMNMTSNHDMNSWEGTEFERLGSLSSAFAVLTYTIPGMPLIYTGQETGLDRRLEFFIKDKAPDWTIDEYFNFYKTLNELKHSQKALAAGIAGGEMVRYPTESNDLYVFSRTKDESNVMVMVNLGAEEQNVVFKDKAPEIKDNCINFFTKEKAALPEVLASGEYLVFVEN